MQRGVISSLCAFLTIPMLAEADSGEAYEYLTKQNIEVIAINENTALSNLSLKSAITDQGLVYFDHEKEIFFVQTKPLVRKQIGGQLDLADRAFYQQFLEQLPGVIHLKSPNEITTAFVFSDISCDWCQRLHHNSQAYLDKGISLKIVLFPRNGLSTVEAKQMSSISQSSNPADALDTVFKGGYISPSEVNETIRMHYMAGNGLNITRTPTLVIDGYPFEGFLTPEQIIDVFVSK